MKSLNRYSNSYQSYRKNKYMAEIPITPDVARDLGRGRFGEAPVTPDANVDAAVQNFRNGKAEQALLELASPAAVPHDRKDVKDSLINRYSTERNGDGKRADPVDAQERRRLREARSKVETYRDFLENGTISPAIRNEVRGFLTRASVGFQDAIVGMTPVQVDALVDDQILNDPIFRSKLIRIYGERANPRKSLQSEKEVYDLELSLSKLESKLVGEVTPAEMTVAETARTNAEATLITAGVNITEYSGYKADFDNLAPHVNEAQSLVTSLQASHGQIDAQIGVLQTQLDSGTPAPGTQDYQRIFSTLGTLKANPDYVNFRTANATVDRFNNARSYLDGVNLDAAKKTAINEFSAAQSKLKSLQDKAGGSMSPSERADIDAQIKNLKIELADARDSLQKEMIDDYRSVTHIAEDVTQEMLAEEMQQLPELYRTARTGEQTIEQEQLSSATEKLHKIWKDPVVRRGVTSLVTNRARAGQWVNAWTQQGNEGIRTQMLGIPNPDLAAAGLTPEEIAVFHTTLADPNRSQAFLNEAADVVASQALADYVSSGGRLGRVEITAITSSAKGRDLISRAMTDVDAQRAAKNAMAGRGVLRGVDNIIGGRASGEKRHFGPARLSLAILLLIFGAAAFKGSKG